MSTFDFETMRSALETRDAERLFDLYDPDARLQVVNKDSPPSRPFEAAGRYEIEKYLSELLDREMTHEVGNVVIGSDRISYTEACEYPDGTRVLGANVLELRDGRIASHTTVETWDE